MSFYIAKALQVPFDAAIEKLTVALNKEGFGILTGIDVRETLKRKLGIDWRPYHILGACNPPLARQALEAEDKIGTMLPCNVIVQDLGDGRVEVAAIDPVGTMERIGNPKLTELARSVWSKLSAVISRL
jgi:uncharacterized protein (DUF302 family)